MSHVPIPYFLGDKSGKLVSSLGPIPSSRSSGYVTARNGGGPKSPHRETIKKTSEDKAGKRPARVRKNDTTGWIKNDARQTTGGRGARYNCCLIAFLDLVFDLWVCLSYAIASRSICNRGTSGFGKKPIKNARKGKGVPLPRLNPGRGIIQTDFIRVQLLKKGVKENS